jgi:hypothetical protein
MFRDAYEKARAFTRPVVQFGLTVEGKCTAGAAAFVVVNSDGWFVTAAHVIKSSRLHKIRLRCACVGKRTRQHQSGFNAKRRPA